MPPPATQHARASAGTRRVAAARAREAAVHRRWQRNPARSGAARVTGLRKSKLARLIVLGAIVCLFSVILGTRRAAQFRETVRVMAELRALTIAEAERPRTVLITGGGRGLGLALASLLGDKLNQTVIITTRDEAQGDAALAAMRRLKPEARVSRYRLALDKLSDAEALVSALRRDNVRLDVVVHNAARMAYNEPRRLVSFQHGRVEIEDTLLINAVAPYHLSRALVPLMNENGRFVFVSSRLHLPNGQGPTRFVTKFNFSDPNFDHAPFTSDAAYKNSKLAVLWVAYHLNAEFARSNSSLTSSALCPGFIPGTAQINRTAEPLMYYSMRYILPLMPFAKSTHDAAASMAWVALHPSTGHPGARFFTEFSLGQSSPDSRNETLAEQFIAMADRWIAAAAISCDQGESAANDSVCPI